MGHDYSELDILQMHMSSLYRAHGRIEGYVRGVLSERADERPETVEYESTDRRRLSRNDLLYVDGDRETYRVTEDGTRELASRVSAEDIGVAISEDGTVIVGSTVDHPARSFVLTDEQLAFVERFVESVEIHDDRVASARERIDEQSMALSETRSDH